MALTEDLPWTCRCGTANVARARVSWPMTGTGPEDAADLQSLLSNTFHTFHCVRCGFPAVVDRNLLVIHHGARWAIQVAHGPGERASIAPKLAQGFPGYRTRVVPDRLALVERARALHLGIDDVALEFARFEHGLALGLSVDPHSRLLFERVQGDEIVFGLFHKGAKTAELTTPQARFQTLASAYATASFLSGPIVDESLVRRLLDAARRPPPIHRYTPLPFAASELHATSDGFVASNRQVAVSVATATGKVTPVPVPGGRPPIRPLPLGLGAEETLVGPFTTFENTRVYGEVLDAAVTHTPEGRVALAVLALDWPGHSPVVVPWIPPANAAPSQLDAFVFASPMIVADEDGIAVIERGGNAPFFFLFRAVDVGGGPEIAATCVPLPDAFAGRGLVTAALNSEFLAVACGNDLVLYARGDLGIRPGFARQAADLIPWKLPRQTLALPGKVVMGVGAKLLVDHPAVGRLTLERPPTLAVTAGEEIRIDDVREDLPGHLRVCAYSFPDGRSWAAPELPVRKLPAVMPPAAIAPMPPAGPPPRPRPSRVADLEALANTYGIQVPPRLLALATAERDLPAAARALERLGLSLRPSGGNLVADWGADPHLFPLVEHGNGDVDGLYLYPPLLGAGEEPFMASFFHETGEIEVCAPSFDRYLEDALAAADPSKSALVALLRTLLPPAPALISQTPPPGKLPAVVSDDASSGRIAEELTLRNALIDGPSEGALTKLLVLYKDLGWGYAAAVTEEALRLVQASP